MIQDCSHPRFVPIASCLWLLVLLHSGVSGGGTGLITVSPALVTADQLEAKLAAAEADPGLTGDAKTKRVALYRKALSNLRRQFTDADPARLHRRSGRPARHHHRSAQDDLTANQTQRRGSE